MNTRRTKTDWRIVIIISFLIFITFVPQPAFSQIEPITANLNRENYSTDDLVILTVTVINDDSPQQLRPILPNLSGLAVINFDIATNVRNINGRIQTESIYTYQLQPRRTGEITIPPIAVKVDGEIYRTASLSFMVRQGNPPAPATGQWSAPPNITPPKNLKSQDLFVEAVADISTPYVGQQLTYTFRFYQAIKLYTKPQFELPIFNGVDTSGLPVREYNLEAAGRTYLVTELRTLLFPHFDGNIIIGPALMSIPGNFFEESIQLYTEPVMLQTKPLPNNAPAGFKGAVGQYQLESWISPQVAVANQPASYQVAISGAGDIRALPEPVWPRFKEWRIYDSSTSLTLDSSQGQMTGTRIYERLIIATQTGDFTIPQTKFVYFDPITEEYKTLTGKSHSIRVIPAPTPDSDTATAMALAAQPTATTGPPARPVNPRLADSQSSTFPLIISVVAVLLWLICAAVPIATVMGAGGFWLWQKYQHQTEEKAQELKLPATKMHPQLAAALVQLNNDNYKAVSQVLHDYLADTLGVSTRGLTQTDLSKRLKEKGVPKSLINKIKDYLNRSEMARFGPGADDNGWELLARTDELLFELDKVVEGL